MRLSACQLSRYLLQHQSFVEGSVKREGLNAGTLCSQFLTIAFTPCLTIAMVLVTYVTQTMTMSMGLARAQGHVHEFRE